MPKPRRATREEIMESLLEVYAMEAHLLAVLDLQREEDHPSHSNHLAASEAHLENLSIKFESWGVNHTS